MRDEHGKEVLSMSDPQFRAFVDNQFRVYEQQLQAGAEQFKQLHEALAANTEMTKKVAESTAEIVTAFNATKRGVNFFSSVGYWLNKIARWATPIITVAAIIWALMHGQWPRGE